ncbi:MAG TPA: NMP kinase [Thermoplasmatales archaeon]|nr:NMP kinase [Thermoplasmatales archaeon]
MKIALTGTPGVGKTGVANELEKKGYSLLRIEEIADNFVIGYDNERESKIVDEEKMDEYIKKIEEKDKILIIEGHLSHLMSVDGVIILRCHPSELKKRLEKKKWNEKKIKENLEAEALDIILQRALERHKKIWEIDTTGKKLDEVVEEVEEILKKLPPPLYGKLDYSEWLIENA